MLRSTLKEISWCIPHAKKGTHVPGGHVDASLSDFLIRESQASSSGQLPERFE